MRQSNQPRAGGRPRFRLPASARLAAWLAVAVAALLVGACGAGGADSTFLAPRGPVAALQRTHFLQVIALLAVVVVPVLVLTPLFVWRYRYARATGEYRPNWEFSKGLEVLIWGVPIAIVAVLATILVRSTLAIDPYRPLPAGGPPGGPGAEGAAVADLPSMAVHVVGTDWKWLFVYPELGIATVDELAFPTDRQLALDITSLTTVQSFFIPALGSQIYAMGGMANRLHLAADAPGDFLGENTQYNGEGFAGQKFVARALAPADFDAWVETVRGSGVALDDRALSVVTDRNTVEEARAALPGAGEEAGTLYFDGVPDHLLERLMALTRNTPDGHLEGALPALPPSHGTPSHGTPSHGTPSHGASPDGASPDGASSRGVPSEDGPPADGPPAGGEGGEAATRDPSAAETDR